MRSSWSHCLIPLWVALELACSPPVPGSPDAADTADATSSSADPAPVETGAAPAPTPVGFDPPFATGDPTGDPAAEVFSADFVPLFPTREAGPTDAWQALGGLTGRYEVTVTRIGDDCTYAPDVPFEALRGPWLDPGEDVVFPFSERYDTMLVERGDALGFELGEGIVFAREAGPRLTDVERIGAEGVTHYLDGFRVDRAGEDGDRLLISGESAWTFDASHLTWVGRSAAVAPSGKCCARRKVRFPTAAISRSSCAGTQAVAPIWI